MPNWKKVIVSGSAAEITTLKLTGTSGQSSEATSLMINGSGVVGTRELGSNAFNSTSFLSSLDGAVLTTGDQSISGVKTFNGGIITGEGSVLMGALPAQNSEATSVMINGSGILGTRELGTGAFAAAVTNNSGLTNGAGYTTNTGTVDTSGTPVDNDYAKFTDANTIEGRSASEVKSDLSLNNVENTAISTFAGSTNITTLGTIGTGTWNGTAIADAYLSSNTAHLSGAQTFTGNKSFSGTFSTSNSMKFTGLSSVESDSKVVVINGETGVVGTRDLGSNAFNSTAFTTNTGTVTGTGTDNFLPKWNSATTGLENSEISDTGALVKIGNDASNQETLYINTTDRKVGFRTSSPGSAFDVNGTMRVRNQLNVGNTSEKNLFVNGNGSAGGHYVQLGNYLTPTTSWPSNGNYFGITERENQPKYFLATGTGGKIVQGMRVVTIKLTGGSNAFKLLKTTGTTLIPAPGSDYFIVPHHCTVHCTGGTKGVWSTGATAAIGFCSGASACSYPNQFNRVFRFTNAMLNLNNTSWIYSQSSNNTGMTTGTNRALIFKAGTDLTTVPAGDWYFQIHYQLINKTAGITANADKVMTANT